MNGEKEGNKLAEEPITKAEVTLLSPGHRASKKTLWGPMPPAVPRLFPHQVVPTTGDPP